MKKKIAALVVCMLAALSLVALSGCNSGPKAEDVIRDGISSELDQIVNQKGDDWDSMVSSIDSSMGSQLTQYGIDNEEFVKTYLDGFAYTINSVDVDEDNKTATANVTITCKSLSDMQSKMTDAVNALAEDSSVASLSQDELYAKVGETIMDSISNTENHDVDVDMQYNCDDDGNWTEDSSVSDAISNAMLS